MNQTSYSGPAFPFSNSIPGVLGNKDRRNSLFTSIVLILTTPVGHLPWNPEFGSQIPSLVFDPLTDETLNLIWYYVVNDIERQDRRIKVTSIKVDKKSNRKITVWVGYIDRNDELSVQRQAPVNFPGR